MRILSNEELLEIESLRRLGSWTTGSTTTLMTVDFLDMVDNLRAAKSDIKALREHLDRMMICPHGRDTEELLKHTKRWED